MASRADVSRAIGEVRRLELEGNFAGLIQQLSNPLQRPSRRGFGIVRKHAAYSLGKLGNPRAIPHLVALVDEPSEHVRSAAIAALAELGDSSLGQIFVGALDDPSRLVRINAAYGLGQVGSTDATDRLWKSVELDHDPWVRLYAAEALVKLGDTSISRVVARELAKAKWDRGRRKRWADLQGEAVAG